MIRPEHRRSTAASDEALGRLDAWERYGRILAAQLEALDGDPDMERFNALARERSALATEIESRHATPAGPESQALVARIREKLQECRQADRALIQRLTELRRGTLHALKGMDDRQASRDGYLAAAAPEKAIATHHIDVRS